MGIVPLWGFQMLIAIAVSIYYRLNKALVLIAANISVPPLIPLVIYLSHVTGKIWMGKAARSLSFDKELTLQDIQTDLVQYALGAVTLAILSGLFFGAITFILLKIFRAKKPLTQA
jgi:uncharacterized protein (DUF2062 family)